MSPASAAARGVFAPGARLYCLALQHRTADRVRVGALGEIELPRGWIYYVGRDRRGWTVRCRRYTNGPAAPHWHIDYLLVANAVSLEGVAPVPWGAERECELMGRLLECVETRILHPGLGAGDCSSGCGAHAAVSRRDPPSLYRSLLGTVEEARGWVRLGEDACRWRTPHGP